MPPVQPSGEKGKHKLRQFKFPVAARAAASWGIFQSVPATPASHRHTQPPLSHNKDILMGWFLAILFSKHPGFTEQFPGKSNSADPELENRAAGRPCQLAGFFFSPLGMILNALYLANHSAFGPHKPQMIPSHLKARKAFYLPSCNKTVTLKASSILNIGINFCWPSHQVQTMLRAIICFSYSFQSRKDLTLAVPPNKKSTLDLHRRTVTLPKIRATSSTLWRQSFIETPNFAHSKLYLAEMVF